MRVGICYTKTAAAHLLDAFSAGVITSGDNIISIYRHEHTKLLRYCDVTVQASAHNRHQIGEMNELRNIVQTSSKTDNRPALIMDTGAIDSTCATQIGYGGIKGLANFNNANSPSDRWDNLGITIKPWARNGEEVIILGQNKNGISTQDNDIFKTYDDIISQIPQHYTITYRHHPKCGIDYQNERITKYSRGEKLVDDLKNALCTVSWSTNAVVEAIINGVPSIALCNGSVASQCYQKTLDIDSANTFDRNQWLYNLAYSEWSQEEMQDGLPWRHLREHVENNLSRK